MHAQRIRPVSGHVYCVERKRGAKWYSKVRLPDGRQVQKMLGPAWTGKGWWKAHRDSRDERARARIDAQMISCKGSCRKPRNLVKIGPGLWRFEVNPGVCVGIDIDNFKASPGNENTVGAANVPCQ